MTTTATTTRPQPFAELQRLRAEASRAGWLGIGRRLVREVSENGLVVFASALAFRVLFAIVPFLLFTVALLGFLSLEEVWRDSVAPEIRERTSDAAFTLIDSTARRALSVQEGFWLTAGAALALWEVAAAVRVSMRALDQIYEERRPRSGAARLAVSFALSLPVAGCLLGALAAAQLLPPFVDRYGGGAVVEAVAQFAGWGLGAVLMALAVALLVRYGPSSPQPFQLVGAASLFVVVSWAIVSALFGIYATQLASYGSVFGGLAFAIILLTYLFLSSLSFLAGLQLEAFLRRGADDADRPADGSGAARVPARAVR